MKLKSKNSFLKRISCIALSLMLCLTSFTLAGFVPTVEAEAAEFAEAVSRFETDMAQMANGTVMYQSVKPAYEAYVNYFDTLKSLCEGKSADLETAANNLTNAVDTMEANRFSAPTGTFANQLGGANKIFIDANNNSTDEYKRIYINVLYSERGIDDKDKDTAAKVTGFASGKWNYKTDNKVFIPEATLLYNGSADPQVGAMYALWGNSKPIGWNWNNLRVFACYVSNTTDIGFAGQWKGHDGRLNHTWVWKTKGYLNISGTVDTKSTYYNQGTGDECFYSNVLKVNRTFTEDDQLLYSYTPNFTVRVGYNEGNAAKELTGNRTIRIVNYKNIIGRIKKAEKKYYANVSNYRQGGLRDYIRVIDEIKAKNPNDFFSLTSNDYNGLVTYYDNQFTALDWFNAKADSDVNHADSSYDWTVTKEATCTETGSKNGVCRYCGATTTATIDALGHNYKNQGISGDKATVMCSKCGHHYELDYSAYKAELTILQDKLADTDRYTPSSIEAATKAMNDVIANVRKPLTKEEVDALVNDLKDAENSLVVNKFTLTFNVYLGEDKKELKYTKPLNDVPYGDSRLLSLPETYQTGYAVTKWTRTIKSSDSIIGTTTSSLTIIANSDASYNVFIKSTADPVDTKMVTATLNNKSNKVVDVAYVNKGINTVSINNSSITLTNGDSKTTLTAPSYSFYYVSGFTVNGLDVYDGSSVEINDTTVIRPIYDVNDRFTVVLDTNVKTNKGETGSVEKGWDERITVTADDADENTQWLYQYLKSDGSYSNAEVIGYGKTVSLQVTQSCMISYNNGQTAQPKVSMDYVSYDVYKAKTITAVGRYYLPENCTKVRAGVILKTSNKKVGATNTPSRDALLNKDNYKVTNKSGVFEATSFVNGTNQYAINFYSSSDYEIMYIGAVAYLTYTDASGEHTIYSDIATYEYNNASAE